MKKTDWRKFEKILKEKKITELYHFTDFENIKSIIDNNGIYSWKSCKNNGITIQRAGGSILSHSLDIKKGIEDFVHLSFTPQHPMLYDTIDDGRIKNPILLIIDIDVIYLQETIFSDRNATDNRAKISSNIIEFENINFDLIANNKYFELDENDQHYFQAEVMVKEFIPLKYIKNIYDLTNEDTQKKLFKSKLLFKIPDCKNVKFDIVNQFYRKQEDGIGNPMTKLKPGETPDLNDSDLRIFNVMYVDSFENPFAIEIGELNRYNFSSVIDIVDNHFSLNPRAVLSSSNGKLTFSLI